MSVTEDPLSPWFGKTEEDFDDAAAAWEKRRQTSATTQKVADLATALEGLDYRSLADADEATQRKFMEAALEADRIRRRFVDEIDFRDATFSTRSLCDTPVETHIYVVTDPSVNDEVYTRRHDNDPVVIATTHEPYQRLRQILPDATRTE